MIKRLFAILTLAVGALAVPSSAHAATQTHTGSCYQRIYFGNGTSTVVDSLADMYWRDLWYEGFTINDDDPQHSSSFVYTSSFRVQYHEPDGTVIAQWDYNPYSTYGLYEEGPIHYYYNPNGPTRYRYWTVYTKWWDNYDNRTVGCVYLVDPSGSYT
jgi:hypothetical protein